jgi:WD40 repeat protein
MISQTRQSQRVRSTAIVPGIHELLRLLPPIASHIGVRSAGVNTMAGPIPPDDGEEILRMQRGVRDWVLRSSRQGEQGFRRVSPPVLLSRLWDVATGRQIGAPLSGDAFILNAVTFSPDGRTLATASFDGTARLWNVTTQRKIGSAMTGGRLTVGVAFSPDGTKLATANYDGTARLWDVATHHQIGKPMTADASFLSEVAFSPGGTKLATASWDGTARLWATATHQQIGSALTAGTGAVTGSESGIVQSVAFSRDGTLLATASWDGTARLWDVATQLQRWRPARHSAAARAAFRAGPPAQRRGPGRSGSAHSRLAP